MWIIKNYKKSYKNYKQKQYLIILQNQKNPKKLWQKELFLIKMFVVI